MRRIWLKSFRFKVSGLKFQVSSFRFQVCGTKFTSSVRYGSGHRVARSFFEVDGVESTSKRRFTFLLHFDKVYFLEGIVPLRGL